MAGITSTRRRAAILAVTALAALSLVACGKKDGGATASSTTGSGDAQLGTVPPTTNAAGSGGGQPTASSTGNQSPLYPKDAKSYGLEILKAWGAKNSSRLSQLVDQSTVQMVGTYPALNASWSYLGCVPNTTANTDCSYANANGDGAVVSMRNTQLGFPTAGTSVVIDKTAFATSVSSYVGDFVGAWGQGNYARMAAYSSKTIADKFRTLTVITSYTIEPQKSCGSKTCVQIDGLGANLGMSETVQVDTTKISQGKANGIIGYGTA